MDKDKSAEGVEHSGTNEKPDTGPEDIQEAEGGENGGIEDNDDKQGFKSKWPNQMIRIPKQRQSQSNRVTKEYLTSEKILGAPPHTFQQQIADMTILTDSDTDQSSVEYFNKQTDTHSSKENLERQKSKKTKSVTFAEQGLLERLLQERKIKESDIVSILQQLSGKGLSEGEKQNIIQKRLDDIETKNIYRTSINASYADMPKVFAFEVENNIRTSIAKLLKPVMETYVRVTDNVADLNQCYGEVTRSIEKVNFKIDKELQLNEKIDNLKVQYNKFRIDCDQNNEKVYKKISELNQLYNIHEDKLARFNDEKNRLTQSRDQMRADIREFEKLVQEVANMARVQTSDIQEDFNYQISNMQLKLDQIMFDHRTSQDYIQSQKPKQQQVDAEIQMMKQQLQRQQVSIYRFENIEKIVAQNEHFLGYILPLRIEQQINDSLRIFEESNPELALDLLSNQKDRVISLQDKLESLDKKIFDLKKKGKGETTAESEIILSAFDKVNVKLPDFDKIIQNLNQVIQSQKEEQDRIRQQEMADESQQSSKESLENNKIKSNDSDLSDVSVGVKSRKANLSTQRSKMSNKKSRQSGGFSNQNAFQGSLKLKNLSISNKQLLQFSSRVGRRLLKNQQFLDKLADCLDNFSVSDTSEKEEDKWGTGDGQGDLAGYEDLYSDGQLESSASDQTTSPVSRHKGRKQKSIRSSSLSESISKSSNSEQEDSEFSSDSENISEASMDSNSEINQSKKSQILSQGQRSSTLDDQSSKQPKQSESQNNDQDNKKKTKRVEFIQNEQNEDSSILNDSQSQITHLDASQNNAEMSKQSSKSFLKENDNDNDQANEHSNQTKQVEDRSKKSKRDDLKKEKQKTSKTKEKKKKEIKEHSSRSKKSYEPDQIDSTRSKRRSKDQNLKTQVDQKDNKKEGRRSRRRNIDEEPQLNQGRERRSKTENTTPNDDKTSRDQDQQSSDLKNLSKNKSRSSRKQRGDNDRRKRKDEGQHQSVDTPLNESLVIKDNQKTSSKSKSKQKTQQSSKVNQKNRKSKDRSRGESRDKKKEKSSQKEKERSPSIRQRDSRQFNDGLTSSKKHETVRYKKDKSIPRVKDIDEQFYKLEKYIAELQTKLKRIEKAQGSKIQSNDLKKQEKKSTKRDDHSAAEVKAPKKKSDYIDRKPLQINDGNLISSNNQSQLSNDQVIVKEMDDQNDQKTPSSQSDRSSSSSSSNTDSSMDINDRLDKLSNDFKQLKNNFNRYTSDAQTSRKGLAATASEMLNQMTLKSSEMKQNLEKQKDQFDLIKDEMKKELKRLQRQDYTNSKGHEELQQQLQVILSKQQSISHSQMLQDQTFAIIFKLLRINYALLHQDEIDKQNIFLLGSNHSNKKPKGSFPESQHPGGYQEKNLVDAQSSQHNSPSRMNQLTENNKVNNSSLMGNELPQVKLKNQPHPLLQFDKTCISCGGPGQKAQQIPTFIKAFKMACLSYQPSSVVFDQKIYQRNELVEAQGYLLYLSLRQLQHLDFNSVDNILLGGRPEKIIYQEFINTHQDKQSLDDFVQHCFGLDKSNNDRIDRNDFKGNHNQSGIYNLNDQSLFATESANQGSCDHSLFGGQSTEIMTSSGNPVVTQTQSKDFSIMASQIPHIIGIKDGNPAITATEQSEFKDPKDKEILRMVQSVTKPANNPYKTKQSSNNGLFSPSNIRKTPKQDLVEEQRDQIDELSMNAHKINQQTSQNFNTIQPSKLFLTSNCSNSKQSTTDHKFLSPGLGGSGNNRLGKTMIGLNRRSNLRKDQNIDAKLASFSKSNNPVDPFQSTQNSFGKTRLFSIDFGSKDVGGISNILNPKLNLSQARETVTTAQGPKNTTGYHASLPRVQNTHRIATNDYYKGVNLARQSYENFGNRDGGSYPLSGTSGDSVSQSMAGGIGSVAKTARIGFSKDSEKPGSILHSQHRFA